jgi:Cu(I)/Ag(I) efflux system periplasmic protein CusF
MDRISLALAAILAAGTPALAQHAHPAPDKSKVAAPAGAMTEGEVRKVDKGAGKITLKHGPIANLEMPPMTMVFRVKDPAMVDRVKAGDAVRFRAEQVNGTYTVTELQPAK